MADPAERDLDIKKRFERQLVPKLRRVDRDLARQVAVSVGVTNVLPNVEQLSASAYEPVLVDHNGEVSADFGTRLRRVIETSPEEDEVIDEALLAAGALRATQQARIWGETNTDDANQALATARDQAAADGLSRQEMGATTGALLFRRLRGREGTRALTETQMDAEQSKEIEAVELTGPLSSPGKRWDSQGDNVVRPWHLEVDSDVVLIGEAFFVNGELLRFPGDTSLGATASNVAGCRCSAFYDPDQIVASRR